MKIAERCNPYNFPLNLISYPRALLDIGTGSYDKTVSQVSVNPGGINILA